MTVTEVNERLAISDSGIKIWCRYAWRAWCVGQTQGGGPSIFDPGDFKLRQGTHQRFVASVRQQAFNLFLRRSAKFLRLAVDVATSHREVKSRDHRRAGQKKVHSRTLGE